MQCALSFGKSDDDDDDDDDDDNDRQCVENQAGVEVDGDDPHAESSPLMIISSGFLPGYGADYDKDNN